MAGVNEKKEIKYTILENKAFDLDYHFIEYLFVNTKLWGSLDDELKKKFKSIIAKYQLISTSSKGFDGFKFEDKDLFDDVIRVKNGGENLFGFVFRQNGKAYIFLEEYAGAQNSHNFSKEQINARMLNLRNWTYQENDPIRKEILDAIGKEEQIKEEQRERAEKENLKKNDTNNFANVIDIKSLFKEESKKNDFFISTNYGQEAPENQSDDFEEIKKWHQGIQNAQYKITTLLSKKSEWNKKLIAFSEKTEEDLRTFLKF